MLANIIVGIIILIALFFVGKKFYGTFKGKSGCGCGDGNSKGGGCCSSKGGCGCTMSEEDMRK